MEQKEEKEHVSRVDGGACLDRPTASTGSTASANEVFIVVSMNDYVSVRLTDDAKAYLRKRFADLNARAEWSLPGDGVPDESEDGYSRWLLWDLFSTVGPIICHGRLSPFDPNVVRVEPKVEW